MRFRRSKLVALFFLCAYVASFAMQSTRDQEPSMSPDSFQELTVARQQSEIAEEVGRWYQAASATTLPEPSEGNMRAQRTQELSMSQDAVAQVICSVFVEDCQHAVSIATCESGLNPEARNRSGAVGVFQLLGHGDMFTAHGWDVANDWDDVYRNSVVAHDLWSSSGWAPWVCKA